MDSIIHTDKEKMILTPTYHVFDLYKEHQDNQLVDSFLETTTIEIDNDTIPAVSQSASIDDSGCLHITLSNCSLEDDFAIHCTLLYKEYKKYTGRILTGDVHDHNTFRNPDNVKIVSFNDMTLDSGKLTVNIPKCSIISISLMP